MIAGSINVGILESLTTLFYGDNIGYQSINRPIRQELINQVGFVLSVEKLDIRLIHAGGSKEYPRI